METVFSRRLSFLMKERRISGQRIGDAIGKSQKTISRYANGEVDPDLETKNLIYKVIADISGIEDDGLTDEEIKFRNSLCDLFDFDENGAEMQMARDFEEEHDCVIEYLFEYYHKLSLSAKKYYNDNMELFLSVESWEIEVLDCFHNMKKENQEKLIQHLENFNFDFAQIANSSTYKISEYLRMVNQSKERPVLLVEGNRDDDLYSEEEQILEKDFHFYVHTNNSTELFVEPEYLSFSPRDWYFLLRVQIYELYEPDDKLYLWGYCDDDTMLHYNLMNLMNSYR